MAKKQQPQQKQPQQQQQPNNNECVRRYWSIYEKFSWVNLVTIKKGINQVIVHEVRFFLHENAYKTKFSLNV